MITDTESVDLDTPTGPMRTYLFRPVAEGRYPGLVQSQIKDSGVFSASEFSSRAMQANQAASRRRLDDLFQSMLHRAFNRLVAPTIHHSQVLQRQTANLRRTRDLLLPRLLSGQVPLTERVA